MSLEVNPNYPIESQSSSGAFKAEITVNDGKGKIIAKVRLYDGYALVAPSDKNKGTEALKEALALLMKKGNFPVKLEKQPNGSWQVVFGNPKEILGIKPGTLTELPAGIKKLLDSVSSKTIIDFRPIYLADLKARMGKLLDSLPPKILLEPPIASLADLKTRLGKLLDSIPPKVIIEFGLINAAELKTFIGKLLDSVPPKNILGSPILNLTDLKARFGKLLDSMPPKILE